MEAHDYLVNQAIREKGAAIWRVLNLPGEKVFDENLIDANDRACSYLDSYQKTAWGHYLDGFTPEEVARLMDMDEGEVDLIVEITRSRISGLL